MNILVTGGAGFIGSHFCDLIAPLCDNLIVLDKLTYAGNMDNLSKVSGFKHYSLDIGDICDTDLVSSLLKHNEITHLVNFAAESHVDNSINNSDAFIQTNINGTHSLLKACLEWAPKVRYLQVSTDEVFGSLGATGKFTELTSYDPRSPYSSSKAAADHLVMAWHHTYGLDSIITHCSNNYGPRQHKEKLIPKVITNALNGNPIPIYGNGTNIRDWIHVKDHCMGIYLALTKGTSGERYCFGGNQEKTNIELVKDILSELTKKTSNPYQQLIKYTTDRLGHDFRYAIDFSKAEKELGFEPRPIFDISDTLSYYESYKRCC